MCRLTREKLSLNVCSRDMLRRCCSVGGCFITIDSAASDEVTTRSCLLWVARVVAASPKPFFPQLLVSQDLREVNPEGEASKRAMGLLNALVARLCQGMP